jgi:(p)ppGpp synthase/HD superfamily hydrolase
MKDDLVGEYKKRIGCNIENLAEDVLKLAHTVTFSANISFRTKDSVTLKKKMRMKNVDDIFLIDDVFGIRIFVDSVADAYKVFEKIKETFGGLLDHDYIAYPKTRADESALKGKMLRLLQLIAYKNGVPFEIQITTREFHQENELLHARYHQRKYRT